MELVIIAVLVTLVTSFCCSITEAALFAVPVSFARSLADGGSARGKMLLKLKDEIGHSIAAILLLNTLANSIGPAVAGATVVAKYGEGPFAVFSLGFAIAILFFGEIFPKKIGALYPRAVAPFVALPLSVAIRLLYPFILLVEFVTKSFGSKDDIPTVSGAEVVSLAEIGREEGVFDHLEGLVIKNIIGLDKLQVRDVLTPRVVVFRVPQHLTLEEIKSQIQDWNHTRVPIYDEQKPDIVSQYVIQKDLLCAIIRGETAKTLEDFGRSLQTIPELMRVDVLFSQMLEQGDTIRSVVDEHGGFAGLISLEDLIEEVVGREIVDEYDVIGDLRTYAHLRHKARNKHHRT